MGSDILFFAHAALKSPARLCQVLGTLPGVPVSFRLPDWGIVSRYRRDGQPVVAAVPSPGNQIWGRLWSLTPETFETVVSHEARESETHPEIIRLPDGRPAIIFSLNDVQPENPETGESGWRVAWAAEK